MAGNIRNSQLHSASEIPISNGLVMADEHGTISKWLVGSYLTPTITNLKEHIYIATSNQKIFDISDVWIENTDILKIYLNGQRILENIDYTKSELNKTITLINSRESGDSILAESYTIENIYTLPTASSTTLGGIKVGNNLTITDGVLSADAQPYNLPIASASVLGGIKVGNNLTIRDGVLSANAEPYSLPVATSTTLGGVKIGNGFSVVNGMLNADPQSYTFPTATSEIVGGIKLGNGFIMDNSVMSLGTPSTITSATENSVTATSHTHAITGFVTPTDITNLLRTSGESTSGFLYNGITDTNGQLYGGVTAPTGTVRLNYSGYFYATRVYNAVYNDYAECFDNEILDYKEHQYKIVELDINNKTILANEDSSMVIGVISNSYGHLLGGTEEEIANNTKIPVGLAGVLYVDSKEIVDIKNRGKFVTSAGEGYAKVNENPKLGTIIGKITGIDQVNNRYKIIITLV